MKFWPNLKHSPRNSLIAMMLLSLLMLAGLSGQPAHAKFISADPVTALQHLQNGNIQGFTPYVYANNNPYKFTDPDGRNPIIKFAKGTVKHNGNVVEAAVEVGQDFVTVFAPSSTPAARIEAAISIVSPVDLDDVKSIKKVLDATGKRFGGRKGSAATRAQNQAIGNNIQANGGTVTAGFGGKESHFKSPLGGTKGGRFSDGSATDANGQSFQVQTVDTNAAGKPTHREASAARDIAARSLQPVVCIAKTSC